MKISVKGGGGLAGTVEHADLDTAHLPQGAQLEALLQDLDFFHAGVPPQPVGADIPRWEITVNDGQRDHTVSFADDGSAWSTRWRPLLARLLGR